MSGPGSAVYVAEKNLDKKSVKIPLPENWRQWAVKSSEETSVMELDLLKVQKN